MFKSNIFHSTRDTRYLQGTVHNNTAPGARRVVGGNRLKPKPGHPKCLGQIESPCALSGRRVRSGRSHPSQPAEMTVGARGATQADRMRDGKGQQRVTRGRRVTRNRRAGQQIKMRKKITHHVAAPSRVAFSSERGSTCCLRWGAASGNLPR